MRRLVLVVYSPLEGQGELLDELVRNHVPLLRKEGLVTTREPIIMKAQSGAVIEIFEWKSAQAIEEAHSNGEVQKLWAEFSKVCTYERPVNIEEFDNLFSEFQPAN
jgi:hypothetical protein